MSFPYLEMILYLLTIMEKLTELSRRKGYGTSMVTMIMRAGTNPSDASRRITGELSAAANIRDRKNRNSVLDALRSLQVQVKGLASLPETGVAVFSGWYI